MSHVFPPLKECTMNVPCHYSNAPCIHRVLRGPRPPDRTGGFEDCSFSSGRRGFNVLCPCRPLRWLQEGPRRTAGRACFQEDVPWQQRAMAGGGFRYTPTQQVPVEKRTLVIQRAMFHFHVGESECTIIGSFFVTWRTRGDGGM